MARPLTAAARAPWRRAAVALLLATSLAACKGGQGGPGDAQAKEKEGEVEAIPVEVVEVAVAAADERPGPALSRGGARAPGAPARAR